MLISEEYKKLNERLHATNRNYGAKGHKRGDEIWTRFIERYNIHTLLDYGCGKNTLLQYLEKRYSFFGIGYDPCVEAYAKRPTVGSFDGVVNVGMIEHIEPECLDEVLKDILNFGTEEALYYFFIGLVPSNKLLEDGRNAHLIIEPKEWWIDKLEKNGFWIKFGEEEVYYNEDNSISSKHGFFNCIARRMKSDDKKEDSISKTYAKSPSLKIETHTPASSK